MEIRKAHCQNTQGIKNIAKRVIRHNYTRFLGDEMVSQFIESGQSDKEIENGRNNCEVMLVSGTIIGFAITDTSLLHLIMIDVPYQNKGFGGKLLSYVEAVLFEEHDVIQLQSFEENEEAVGFYLKKGWIIADRKPDPDIGKTMLYFEKKRPL